MKRLCVWNKRRGHCRRGLCCGLRSMRKLCGLWRHRLVSESVGHQISALNARTQLEQIMHRAIENNDRFLVERNGEPAVLILSVTDYVKTFAPPPDWLSKSWENAKRHGLDKLTTKEIDAEIAASRRNRRARKAKSEPAQ